MTTVGPGLVRPFAPGWHVLSAPLRPVSGTTLDLTGVTLQHASNTPSWSLIDVDFVDAVTILGGTFDGNVGGQAVWNEWLHAIRVRSSSRVIIEDCHFYNLCGDGIYVSHASQPEPRAGSRHVAITRCEFWGDNRNRNGVSIVCGHDVVIDGCRFHRMARDPMPGAIDLEPDEADEAISDVIIKRCTITGPGERGVCLYNQIAHAPIRNVTVEDCDVSGHEWGVFLHGANDVQETGLIVRNCRIGHCRIGVSLDKVNAFISDVDYLQCRQRLVRNDKDRKPRRRKQRGRKR